MPDLTQRNVDVTTPVAIDAPRPDSAATSPSDAVDRFVRAEIARDPAASYDLLSASDRSAVRSRAAWERMHSSLPVLTSFTRSTKQVVSSTTEVTIVGDARFEPRLDEIDGLVAAQATVTWTTVAEDGGWRIGYQRTRLVPRQPSEAGASATARAWLAARQNCTEPGPELEYAGGIVGSTGVATALCRTANATLDAPKPLGDRPDPAPVLAAFGTESDTWARTIRVTGPRTFHLALAPFDDHWIVIGVLADGR